MKGIFVKKFTTVVMDGSDATCVESITGIMNMMTDERHGKATCRAFDSDHPTMKVIDIYTRRRRFDQIQKVIEQTYPGLCIFNPAM